MPKTSALDHSAKLPQLEARIFLYINFLVMPSFRNVVANFRLKSIQQALSTASFRKLLLYHIEDLNDSHQQVLAGKII